MPAQVRMIKKNSRSRISLQKFKALVFLPTEFRTVWVHGRNWRNPVVCGESSESCFGKNLTWINGKPLEEGMFPGGASLSKKPCWFYQPEARRLESTSCTYILHAVCQIDCRPGNHLRTPSRPFSQR